MSLPSLLSTTVRITRIHAKNRPSCIASVHRIGMQSGLNDRALAVVVSGLQRLLSNRTSQVGGGRHLVVSPEQKMGRPRSDDRLMLNGIFWILCSAAAWRDLPERFGPWSMVYQRFRDWRDDGTFDQVTILRHFAGLHLDRIPDETTILNFRRLLEKHELASQILEDAYLGERDLLGRMICQIEKAKAQTRAKVEHPFRGIKCQFGYTKVRFRGLAKNTAQLVTLFALSNLWMMRKRLLMAGEVRIKFLGTAGEPGPNTQEAVAAVIDNYGTRRFLLAYDNDIGGDKRSADHRAWLLERYPEAQIEDIRERLGMQRGEDPNQVVLRLREAEIQRSQADRDRSSQPTPTFTERPAKVPAPSTEEAREVPETEQQKPAWTLAQQQPEQHQEHDRDLDMEM